MLQYEALLLWNPIHCAACFMEDTPLPTFLLLVADPHVEKYTEQQN
jgi:hypothetical protein